MTPSTSYLVKHGTIVCYDPAGLLVSTVAQKSRPLQLPLEVLKVMVSVVVLFIVRIEIFTLYTLNPKPYDQTFLLGGGRTFDELLLPSKRRAHLAKP